MAGSGSGPPRKRIQGVPTGSLAANLLIDRMSLHPLFADHNLLPTAPFFPAGKLSIGLVVLWVAT
jgi:hypothetical protein